MTVEVKVMFTVEKRNWPRLSFAADARCRQQNQRITSYHPVEMLDINHQGCRLLGDERFLPGTKLEVLVDLPAEGQFHFVAEAAWSAPVWRGRVFTTGVRFLTDAPISEETYLKLFHYYMMRFPSIAR
ncbi:MAG: PilZ domain-containing protein [Candidatus Omnitrophica bacterium]|nr:PilZ domain-containing protein [Candidatus Omnitrophota bacterium]